MNPNLTLFTSLCDKKGIHYNIIHESGNLIEVKSKTGESHLFTIETTPFNPHSIITLCKDKEFFMSITKSIFECP